MWQLAIKSLLADRTKLAASVLGVAFAVVLANLQGGLLIGLLRKAALLVDYGGADIWVGHRHMKDAETSCIPIPERWLHRIRSVPGVQRADPYILANPRMTMPDGNSEFVVVVGCDPSSLLGNPLARVTGGDPRVLQQPNGILVDEEDLVKLGRCQVGDLRELNGRRARVVGFTQGMVNFTTRPYVFTTLERARRDYGGDLPTEYCSYILVRAEPGADVAQLVEDLRARTHGNLDVYDRDTYSAMSMRHWLLRTGIGISFGLATTLGLLVGLGVVAQTLYTSVTERLKEFGTLKALGADESLVGRFLLLQALTCGVLGAALGLVIARFVAALATSSRAPIVPSGSVMAGSVILVLLVCMLAAWLPYWRIRRIDPASVLRS
jgi:putative ABC transport system permease protein